MSYLDPDKGYKGVTFGGGAMLAAGIYFLVRMSSVTHDMRQHLTLATPEMVEEKLVTNERWGRLYATMRQSYPEDFRALTTQIANQSHDGQPHAAMDASASAFVAVTLQRHRGDLAQAPHIALSAFRAAEIAVVGDLRSTYARVCADYLTKGAVSDDTGSRDLRIEMQQRVMEAEAAGRDTPAGRDLHKPGAAAWRQVAETMAAKGIPRAQIVAFLAPPASSTMAPADRCNAGLAFLRAVDALPEGQADQFAAYMMSHA